MPSFSAALLVGGKSTRMGSDKALLKLLGSNFPLWQHQLRTLEELQPAEIIWSGSERPGLPKNLRIVPDVVQDAGPLAGINACLEACQSDLLVVLAIDLPHMNAPFLNDMLGNSSSSCGAVMKHGDYFEPLAAVYPKMLHYIASQHLRDQNYSLQNLIRTALRENLMKSSDLQPEDETLFKNYNSPVDLL